MSFGYQAYKRSKTERYEAILLARIAAVLMNCDHRMRCHVLRAALREAVWQQAAGGPPT